MSREQFKKVFDKIKIINIFKEDANVKRILYDVDDNTTKKKDYQIAISQDGKFAVTFDTGKNKFVIKIIYNIKHT
jgi:hypothetical protein